MADTVYTKLVEKIIAEHAPPERIAARRAAEKESRELITANLGNLSHEQLSQLFKHADRDYVNGHPKEGRFGITFLGNNSKKICEQPGEANEWIKAFWEVSNEGSFDLMNRFMTEKPIKGAGYGFPSLILYLRDPNIFNIWLNVMIAGLNVVNDGSLATDYKSYNSAVNSFKVDHKLEPQSLDIVLTLLASAKTTSRAGNITDATIPSSEEYLFSTDSFDLLDKLHVAPLSATYQENKEQFKKFVELPLQSLLKEVVTYLPKETISTMETERKIFARILKNDYGKGGAWDYYWGALYPKGGERTSDAQLFIWMDYKSLEAGFYMGEHGTEQRNRFLKNADLYGKEIGKLLDAQNRDKALSLGNKDRIFAGDDISFEQWLKEVSVTGLRAGISIKRTEVLKSSRKELVNRISLLFKQLFPLVLMATLENPISEVVAFVRPIEPKPIEPVFDYYNVLDAMAEVFVDEAEFREILDLLRYKKNIILQGPPGVGKTFIAKRLAYAMMGVKDTSRVEMIQFHQSYSYEDFIQGYRPNGNGGFDRKDGIFFDFCVRAQQDEKRDYFFIIDEINRGNLSKIFGELLMLIESDKRDKSFALPLTYSRTSADRFYLPKNLHFIGTMNTADRSLAIVDYALRRRFSFVTLKPNFSDKFTKHLEAKHVPDVLIKRIIDKITQLNNDISNDHKNLGSGFCIGHSFFCPNGEIANPDQTWFEMIVKREIAPLIREYWFDDENKAQQKIAALLAV